MANFFLNANFLAVAGALVSVPIIIHLINRMRFRRIRWAAMEFLLKAQKRKRKKLIIEQLLLLMLRCLLVALVGFLVARFVGPALEEEEPKPALHIVLVDDTLSMHEEALFTPEEKGKVDRKAGAKKEKKQAFDIAREEVIIEKIAGRERGKRGTPSRKTWGQFDELVVLPLSQLVHGPDFLANLRVFKDLHRGDTLDDLEDKVKEINPVLMHVPMAQGLEKVSEVIQKRKDSQPYLYVVGDFREVDWAGTAVQEKLAQITLDNPDLALRLVDALEPFARSEKYSPDSGDNLAIVDLRPVYRLTPKHRPSEFVMKVKNFGQRNRKFTVKIFDELTGAEVLAKRFHETMPADVPAMGEVEIHFNVILDRNEDVSYQGQHLFLSARLMDQGYGPLTEDGLMEDNIRYTSVELKDRIPVLIVDGGQDDALGRPREPRYRDWLYIKASLLGVVETTNEEPYDVAVGRESLLNNPDLIHRYAAIFLTNVTNLSEEQRHNLESFAAAGGGVAFFMGENVKDGTDYNEQLHRDGQGIFPVKLTERVAVKLVDDTAKADGKDPLDEDPNRESQDLILRDRFFPKDGYPIFGKLLQKEGLKQLNFRNVNVAKYYRVEFPRVEGPKDVDAKEKGAAGEKVVGGPARDPKKRRTWDVQTLANLTSEQVIDKGVHETIVRVFHGNNPDGTPIRIVVGKNPDGTLIEVDTPIRKVLKKKELAKYRIGLEAHIAAVTKALEDFGEKKVFHLARPMDEMLNDPGRKKRNAGGELERDKDGNPIQDPLYPDMRELWKTTDPDVEALRQEITDLYDTFSIGDPLVITSRFGLGRVVVVLTTASESWSGWGGGARPTAFPFFILEAQRYLATNTVRSDYPLTFEPPPPLVLEADLFEQRAADKTFKRFYLTPREKGASTAEEEIKGEDVKSKDKEKAPTLVSFSLTPKKEPGLSIMELYDRNDNLVASLTQVFNLDVERESPLERASDFSPLTNRARKDSTGLFDKTWEDEAKTDKKNVVPESPLFFLLLICVLIAEQALAVHLSFHLRGEELGLPGQAGKGTGPAKAA